MTVLFGIPNCDTIKRARKWLADAGVEYEFHDYKKLGITKDVLAAWAEELGWEVFLNKRGTTFRKLPDADKSSIDLDKALDLMVEHPSMIKRPVLDADGRLIVGFSADEYASTFR